MAWLELTLSTAPAGIAPLCASLTAGGFADLVIEDQNEFETFLEENREYWDYIDEDFQEKLQNLSQIKLYLEDTDSEGLARLEALVSQLKASDPEGLYGSLALSAATLPDTDWEESWKDSYPPQEVGKTLLVLPCWRAEEDHGSRLPVILDPGLTFGTGAHPSTQMVMEVMEETIRPGDHCLDLGSGSGILSIAALRLGAASAIGVDIDPKAEDIARENAAYNGFAAPEFTAITGNVTADRKMMAHLQEKAYRVVLVNIVADVIIGLCPVLPGFLGEESILICSGILDTRLDDVKQALMQAGLELLQVKAKEDWRCICARKK